MKKEKEVHLFIEGNILIARDSEGNTYTVKCYDNTIGMSGYNNVEVFKRVPDPS